MKKFVAMTLVLTAFLGLVSCGGGENNAPPLYSSGHVTKIKESGAFDADLYDLDELDANTAFMLYKLGDYGLTKEDVKECNVLHSAGASCEEAAVLVLSDADKAKTAADALKDYIAGQIEANKDYRPAEIPKLENAFISRRGETLLLVVANDLDAAKEAVGEK